MSESIWIAIGVFLLLEGLAPLIIPATWKHYLRLLSESSSHHLRRVGGIMVVVGVVILYYKLPFN